MSETWTRELVWSRYLGAFETLLRLPHVRGPLKPHTWSHPAPPSHRAIDLMGEVWGWHAKYLASREAEARMLIVMAWHRARHKSLTTLLRSMRIPRRDAYRTRDRALDILRAGLDRDRVPAEALLEVLLA